MELLNGLFENLNLKKSDQDAKITLLQKLWRGRIDRIRFRRDFISSFISLYQRDEELLTKTFIKIIKICHVFPPAKNENKFVYGKLIERVIIEMVNNKMKCIDLDGKHFVGSEYKNDCIIPSVNVKFSIKASKNGGLVTLINKRNQYSHQIEETNFIICHIKERKLFIFKHHPSLNDFIKEDGAAIYYKGSVFKVLKERGNFISFPENEEISNFMNIEVSKISEINIYDVLYNMI